MRRLAVLLCLLLTLAAPAASQRPDDPLDALRRGFLDPPDDARVMMRWWWFGPAITPEQIRRDLDAMRAAGIGGVEIQPVYPFALDDRTRGRRNLRYLSEEFLAALDVANREAHARGLRVDLTLGSGWPYGGPTVAPDEASRLRWERVAVPAGTRRLAIPAMTAGESYLTGFLITGGDPASAQPLPAPDANGEIWLAEVATAECEAWFFLASRTGMMVKRPAYGAEGFVVDHYHRPALDAYLVRVGAPLLRPFGNRPPFAIFCDSLEVYGSDWAPDFVDEFRHRRGYDVLPFLPALAAGTDDAAAQVREDWGLTLRELFDERFLRPLGEWARARGTRLRVQGYGIPPATISSNAAADLPEGEGAFWRKLTAARWAASAAHQQARPVVSSETWTWLHSPAFRATPLDLKVEADRHFLQGINQLIGHGWPSTPPGEPYPGWRFYAAGAFTDANPWWIVMPDVTRSFQRLSHLLRQGTPAIDVAIYLPAADALGRTTPGRLHLLDLTAEHIGEETVSRVLDAGYALDFIDDDAIRGARVERGTLVVGSAAYPIVLLPNVTAIPLDVLQQLQRLADDGGAVIATGRVPSRVPGRDLRGESDALGRLARSLFSGSVPRARLVADLTAIDGVLHELAPPQLRITPQSAAVGFTARRVGDVDLFFVANTGNTAARVTLDIRTPAARAEWWDPITGRMEALEGRARGGLLRVPLELPPYGSGVLVASSRIRARTPARTEVLRRVPVTGPWTLTFDRTGERHQIAVLRSWTDREETRCYSGTATYDTTLDAVAIPDGARVWLRLGEGTPVPETPRALGIRAWLDPPVREAAVVYVDGRRVGSVWSPPFEIDITDALTGASAHRLRLVVGNTAMNHMAGHPQPDFRLLHLRYGQRFDPQDMDAVAPLPSGLLANPELVVIRSGRLTARRR